MPDAHAESPSPISALLSAALLNSAFLMILKVFYITSLAGCDSYAKMMLLLMGFISIFVAAVFVYHINNYKRMLAYSSIENMGILAIGAALGNIGILASIIHLIGHSLVKAAFFMTSGNILKLYDSKKIKSVSGLIQTDKKTGWLWILSFVGIAAFPPSVLFMSEFLIIRTMIYEQKYILTALFLILLTIIIYGIGKAIISMSFGKANDIQIKKQFSWTMYLPQIILLVTAFIIGIYMPQDIINLISESFIEIGG